MAGTESGGAMFFSPEIAKGRQRGLHRKGDAGTDRTEDRTIEN